MPRARATSVEVAKSKRIGLGEKEGRTEHELESREKTNTLPTRRLKRILGGPQGCDNGELGRKT